MSIYWTNFGGRPVQALLKKSKHIESCLKLSVQVAWSETVVQ